MAERARSFGPTVLLGLAGGTLSAVAATRDWARASGDAAGVDVTATVSGSQTAPLAVALALVALAAWGVVLVLRGRARRLAAAVGGVAAVGVLLTTVVAFGSARDDAVEAVVAKGATGDVSGTALTAWYWTTGLAALLTAGTFVTAVRAAASWPAMGSRYDAPATSMPATDREQDMWKALDDGRDPTT